MSSLPVKKQTCLFFYRVTLSLSLSLSITHTPFCAAGLPVDDAQKQEYVYLHMLTHITLSY